MTVLPTVRGQLLLAAERQATSTPAGGEARRGPRLPSRPRPGTVLATVSVAVALGVAALAVVLLHGAGPAHRATGGSHRGHAHHGASPAPTTSLIEVGPLHLPSLRPGGRCPTSRGRAVHNRYFNGVALGSGPVRVLLADRGDVRRGRVDLGTVASHSMHAIQTLWFALPSYRGVFEIRGGRLGRHGRIAVKPGASAQSPGSGPLLVQSGATVNSFPDGIRFVPGSTWVHSPGCYAWQVDGTDFTEVIVFQALAPTGRR